MVFDALIIASDIALFSAEQLEHQYNEKDLGIDFAILCLDDPPNFLIFEIENLSHEFFVFFECEFGAGGEVRGEVD